MKQIEFAFFAVAALMVIVGGIATVGSKNPIRGAMGLLTTIVGIAGMYLLLSAEFLAAIQIIVYAGAVVVLFLFVIMLLGPSATSGRDTRGWTARYLGAAVVLASSVFCAVMLARVSGGKTTTFPAAPKVLGSIEAVGRELFTQDLLPFELSSALLLVAVVGAVAVARGKQIDPTLLPKKDEPKEAA
ncbi:MAG: NADH-quinone oxidoreductase subunit J family protein [Myxococcales bacterium]